MKDVVKIEGNARFESTFEPDHYIKIGGHISPFLLQKPNFIDNFNKLINAINIPVVTTFNGFDLIDTNHHLFAGRIGTIGQRSGNFVLQNADVIHGDGIEFLQTLEHVSVLFLDPARRKEHGSKAILLEDCTPNLLEIKELLLDKADTIVVKLSPMLDWHLAVEQLGSVFEVHVVSVGNECKELILVLRKDYIGTPTLYCVNDGNVFIVDKETKKATLPSAELVSLPLAKYLYEPNASIMKVGCFDEISSFYNISPLGKNSHLFVSAVLAEGFPGRTFKILRLCSMNKHDLRDALKNIDRANFPKPMYEY